jgi:hypothetical protein
MVFEVVLEVHFRLHLWEKLSATALSASILHGQRPYLAARTGAALKSFRPRTGSSGKIRYFFDC